MQAATGTRTQFRNTLLRHLPVDAIDRLQLTQMQLPIRREIEFPGNEIKHLFFLETGIASMTTTFLDGSQVEVALCGFEAVLGASFLMGTRRSLNRVYMQIPGYGYSTKSALAAEEFKRHGEFHRLILRHNQAQFLQTAQTAGCNARHSIRQRLARWLLLCDDRVGHGPIDLAQEFIAEMLGNQRTSISVEASKLQKSRLISYTRGLIVVTDRLGLEGEACECYAAVAKDLQHYADEDWDVERWRFDNRSTAPKRMEGEPALLSADL
jgi:CRP-like cAMP-binding protein